MSNSKGTLAFAILFCMVCLAGTVAVYYPIVNAILVKLGVDGLSLFQMCLMFTFIHYFTNAPDSLYAKTFFKEYEESLSDEQKAKVFAITGIRALLRTGIIYLIWIYLIVPKFM